MLAFRVHRLNVTPIKGFALLHPEAVRLDASGAVGDRDFFLLDEHDKLLSIPATGAFAGISPRFENGGSTLRLVTQNDEVLVDAPVILGKPVIGRFFGPRAVPAKLVEGPFASLLSDVAGKPVRLARADADGAGSDVRPVTILGSASIDDLGARAGEPVDARRFRMLVELETDEPYVEDTWAGRVLAGSHVRVRVGGPVPRCAAITRDPDRGDRDVPLVRIIKDYRGVRETEAGTGPCFGVYGEVLAPGELRRGEELELEDRDDVASTSGQQPGA